MDRRDEAIEQMMKVNAMSREQVESLVRDSFVEFRRQSELEWRFEIVAEVAARFPNVVHALAQS